MNQHAIEKTELNKILALASNFAVLDGGKKRVQNIHPTPNVLEAKRRLKETEECVTLLFIHGVSKVERFEEFGDEISDTEENKEENIKDNPKTGQNKFIIVSLICIISIFFLIYYQKVYYQ